MFTRYRTTPRFGLSLAEEARHAQTTFLKTGSYRTCVVAHGVYEAWRVTAKYRTVLPMTQNIPLRINNRCNEQLISKKQTIFLCALHARLTVYN
jgi:hypothetical protein